MSVDGRPNRRNKVAFCEGLVCTVGLTEEIKPRFQISQSGVVCTGPKTASDYLLEVFFWWTEIEFMHLCRLERETAN